MANRSKWKGPMIGNAVYSALKKKKIKTRNRSQLIIPALLGKIVKVYTGKVYVQFKITQEMIGYKLGTFSVTKVYLKKK